MALLDSKQLNPKLTGSFILSGSTQTLIGSSDFQGSVTASGDISGSATSTGSFGQLEIGNGGDIVLTEDQRIFFEADKATFIESHASDTFRVVVNNRQMFLLDEDTGNRAVFGNGTKVFIGENNNFTPQASLHIAGDIFLSGSNGNVTASGNISSSATITSENSIVKNDLTVGGNLDIADTIFHTGDSNTKIRFPDVDTISFHTSGEERLRISTGGHITASGNISASGDITANEFNGIFNGALSGSAQIADAVSGSFTSVSESLALRLTLEEDEAEGSVISSSAQIADDISGSIANPTVNISGSATSTGSFGRVEAGGTVSADAFVSTTGGATIDFNDDVSLAGSLTTTGKIELGREPVQGFNYLARLAEGKLSSAASAHTFTATAATKTSNHPYKDSGSSQGYIIDGVETPFLYLTEGYYKFDYSGATSHPIRFYFDAAKTTQYNPSTHVSVDGNVITLLIDKDSPQIIYYQCSSHGYMGWAIHTGQNALVQDINGFRTLVSGSAQLAADISGSLGDNAAVIRSLDRTTISGSFTAVSESIASRLTAEESEAEGSVVSSSAQIAADISGSFSKEHLGDKVANVVTSSAQIATDISGSSTALSASLSTRLTTFDITQIDIDGADDIGAAIVDADLFILDDGAGGTNRKATMSRLKSYMGDISGGSTLGNIQVGVTAASEVDTSAGNLTLDSAGGTVVIDDNLQVSGVTTIGDVTVTGTLTAQEVHTAFESASILFTSGSTKLGNSMDDVHNITGSVNTTGSMSADSFEGTFVGALSSSAQISADISGSFSKEHLGAKVANVVTSSAQLAADISGSLGSNASVIRTLTRDTISGSFTTTSSSLASRITIAEDELENTLVSGSAQLAADISGSLGSNADVIRSLDRTTISGSFTSVSSSLASRITAEEAEAEGSVVSSSAQLADDISGSLGANAAVIRTLTRDTISGSFTSTSSSLASRITTAEDELGETLVSGSAQLAADISGSLGSNAAVIRTLTRDTISGSFTSVSESISSRLTAEEGEAEGSVVSSSAQIAADISGSLGDNADVIRSLDRTTISGSFNAVSASLASRITSEEGEAEGSVISSSAQIAADISGSVVNPSGNISGSATSTGSFGEVQVGGMSIESLTTFSSSVATKLDTLDGDIIALSIALG